MQISRIIFDLGNVVLTNDWHDQNLEKYQKFTDYYGIQYSDLEAGWQAAWKDYKIGKSTENEFWKLFLLSAGAKSENITVAKMLWIKYQQPVAGMLDLLALLRSHYRLAVLSNTGAEWLAFKRKKFQLDVYFDVYVSSGDVGFAKPDMKIYKILLQRISESPQNCLFIDDTNSSLVSAETVGIKTIQFENRPQLEKDLHEFGVTW